MTNRSPEELAERARGSLKPKHLTKTSGLVFTHLYDDPLIEYLRPDEQPHYNLATETKGFRITYPDGSEETPHHDASEGKRYLLITDQRLVYVAGRPGGDEMREFSYEELASVRRSEDLALVFETDAGLTYAFSNVRLSADEEAAASYIEERIAEARRSGGEPAAEEPPGGQPTAAAPGRGQRPGGQPTAEGSAGRRDEDRRPDPTPAADRIPPSEAITTPPRIDATYDALEQGERVGTGGNAQVYRAYYGDRELALKVPQFDGTMAADTLESFTEEVETWAGIDEHDHVVSVLGWGRDPVPWLAMEYMDAGSLTERVGRVGVAEGLWYVLAVARALRHAHKHGIAHLDVKPENVLLRATPDGEYDVPKVADWGLARQLLDRGGDRAGLTLQYAAPEQLDSSDPDPDNRTDVYQLGAVAYELFTGRPPFEGPEVEVVDAIREERPAPPSRFAPGLPPALDDVLLTALAKDPTDRQEDVLLVRDAVDELLDDQLRRGSGGGAPVAQTAPAETGAGETAPGETTPAETGAGPTGTAEALRDQLRDLDVYAGQPEGEAVYVLLVYSTADGGDLLEEVRGLRANFDHYDTHVETTVYEPDGGGGETAVTSVWETESAAETAAGFLSDLPGVLRRGDGPDAGDAIGDPATLGGIYQVTNRQRGAFVDTFEAVTVELSAMDGHRETRLLYNPEDGTDTFLDSRWNRRSDAEAARTYLRTGDEESLGTVGRAHEMLAAQPWHVVFA